MNKVSLIFSCLLFIILNGFSQINHWETAVYGSDEWKYFVGNSEPSNNWATADFNDNNWLTGNGPIGYGDGDDATLIEPTYALYIRRQFSIIDLDAISSLILQADYDDAFVAYLNGDEIARANIAGNPIRFNTETETDHEATLYANNRVESIYFDKADLESIFVEGDNLLAISIHNRFGPESSDMTANFFITLGISDDSKNYGTTPSWFQSPFFDTSLPIIKIETSGIGTINNITPISAQFGIINNAFGSNNFLDEPNEYQGKIVIKHRGQSSLWFDKKNFSIEMKDAAGNDIDTSFLNFPKEEDFILHGPYADKSLMRNVFVMHLARKMGQYASRMQYCDLYVNGDYQGIYVMMEKIKRDKDRVDVAKLRETDIEGDELTGGYIYKIDKDEADWFSRYNVFQEFRKLEYQLVYPDIDKVQPEQFTYIQSYVDSFERAMVNPNLRYGGKSFEEYIDLTSFAEAHLLNELGRNVDGYRLSSYFHKQKDSDGGKIFAGPVWDFNLAFRNADYCDGANTEGLIFNQLCDGGYPFWWNALLQNDKFQSIVRCRWEALREGPFHIDSIFTFINNQVEIIQPSLNENFSKWNILGTYLWPNPLPLANTHEQEINLLRDWLSDRLEWMDGNIGEECQTIVDVEDIEDTPTIQIFPNPAKNQFNLIFEDKNEPDILTLFLINEMGQRFPLTYYKKESSIDISLIPAGFYFLEIQTQETAYVQKIIIE